LRPQAIILTHAHLDHVAGLKRGAPCPIYATAQTWASLKRYPVGNRKMVEPRRPVRIGDVEVEAFSVGHSSIAPAVGYRITADGVAVFHVPDVVSIPERHGALSGVRLYIGDGASIVRPILRRRGEGLIGHASVRDQMDWCHDDGVSHAAITHCCSQIVMTEADTAAAQNRGARTRAWRTGDNRACRTETYASQGEAHLTLEQLSEALYSRCRLPKGETGRIAWLCLDLVGLFLRN